MKNTTQLILAVMMLALPAAKATTPEWKHELQKGKQYGMVIYARVVDANGQELLGSGSLLSAREEGKVTGVTPVSRGPKGRLYQLKVGSNKVRADLSYRFYDGMRGRVVEIASGPEFQAQSLVGTIDNPITLKISEK
jgi:hypothetical protein